MAAGFWGNIRPVTSADELLTVIRNAERRSRSFEAIRQLVRRNSAKAALELTSILEDEQVSERAKAIVLYYLTEFQLLPGVASPASTLEEFANLIRGIAEDVEREFEDGRDPFECDDLTNDEIP